MEIFKDPSIPGYQFEIGTTGDFQAEHEAIAALVASRGQVDVEKVREHLPAATIVAVARHNGTIVSVCVLKGARAYNRRVRRKSGFPLGYDVPDPGYAARRTDHEGKRLGRTLHNEILKRVEGDVFATVRSTNPTEPGILERRGFQREGRPWKGQGDYTIVLWYRKAPSRANTKDDGR